MENKVNILGVNIDKVTIDEAVDKIFQMMEALSLSDTILKNKHVICTG